MTDWRCTAERPHGVCKALNDGADAECFACGAERPDTPTARPIPDSVIEAARRVAGILGTDPDAIHITPARETRP